MYNEFDETAAMLEDEDVGEVRSLSIEYNVVEVDDYCESETVTENHRLDFPNVDEVTLDVLLNGFKRMLNTMGFSYVENLIAENTGGDFTVCNGYETMRYSNGQFWNIDVNSDVGGE